jgi:outer membrane lipoprotein-sorting protein
MKAIRLLPLLLACAPVAQISAQDSPSPASKPAPAKNPAEAEAILLKAQAANAKNKAMRADVVMDMNIMGMVMKGTGKMAIGGDGKMRQELTMEGAMMPGAMRVLVVMDGQQMWMQQDLGGMGKFVLKGSAAEMEDYSKKMGGGMPGGDGSQDPASQLEGMRKMFRFDTVETVEIDGRSYIAVTGDADKDMLSGLGKSNPAAGMMSQMMKRGRVLFSKEDYTMTGMEMLGPDGQKIMSMRYKNIERDPKFADDTFKFTPPAGVKVQSFGEYMRSMGGMMGAGDEEEEEDEPASKPASKPSRPG